MAEVQLNRHWITSRTPWWHTGILEATWSPKIVQTKWILSYTHLVDRCIGKLDHGKVVNSHTLSALSLIENGPLSLIFSFKLAIYNMFILVSVPQAVSGKDWNDTNDNETPEAPNLHYN